MTVLVQIRDLYVRRPAAAFAALLLLTLLLWGLSLLLARPADWRPPAGARLALWVHLFTALPAVPLGAFLLWRRKGDAPHRLLGRIWAMLMLTTAVASFWLQGLSGGLSFIHLFSVLTLVSIPYAVLQARRGNIRVHRATLRGVYIGLVAAGMLTLVPGRLLGDLLLG